MCECYQGPLCEDEHCDHESCALIVWDKCDLHMGPPSGQATLVIADGMDVEQLAAILENMKDGETIFIPYPENNNN